MIRSYSELRRIDSFEERFEYLSLKRGVGEATFGFDRYLNQMFYRSHEWKLIRNRVIVRDLGCDLGIPGYDIHDRILIHHMNPMTVDMVVHSDDNLLNPDYLITTSHRTHNAIHYGDKSQLPRPLVERRSGDTLLWNRRNR